MPSFKSDSFIVTEVKPSPNHDARVGGPPDMILLHYTGMRDGEAALARLCAPASKVSAHYVVFEDGRIVQCVPEQRRAWHAGVSSWAGESDINSRSIGIEIVNPGHEFGYTDFPLRQIAAVISLCQVDPDAARADRRRSRAGAFRRRARAQAGSGREISLAAAERIRRRPLGASRRRSTSPAARCNSATAAKASRACSRRCTVTATGSPTAASMTRTRARW